MTADRIALAVAAHPDDIEFMMAGTLLRLRDRGWHIHCMTVADGSCGSAVASADEIAAVRRDEAGIACRTVGAVYHESICRDLHILYTPELISRVLTVVRDVAPRILLVPSPQDYMEDHVNAGRIAVTAAFARGMPNFPSDPPRSPVATDVSVYHAMPHGLLGPLGERIVPGLYVDVSPVMDEKRRMLACHKSQKEWLDRTQGMDAYLDTMRGFSRQMGQMSGVFEFAEGWRRRRYLGFSTYDENPLYEALGDDCLLNEQ